MHMGFQWPALVLTCAITLPAPPVWSAEPSHGFSYFGDLKYPLDMAHFDYVNPGAPKVGRLKLAFIGTINNLNPYVDKGLLSPYINPLGGLGFWIAHCQRARIAATLSRSDSRACFH